VDPHRLDPNLGLCFPSLGTYYFAGGAECKKCSFQASATLILMLWILTDHPDPDAVDPH
jgi:hypothetical protein